MVLPKTKLIRTLITLTPEEWSSFRKHLLIHTRRDSDNFQFFEFLHIRRERLSSINDADEIRKKHFAHLTSKGLSNLMSRLFNWLEDWMAINEFKKQRYQQELMLIKAYNRKGLYKLADSHADKLEQKIKSETQLDLDNNKALYQLYETIYYSNNPIKFTKGHKLMEGLVMCFLISHKEHICIYLPEIFNVGRIQNKDLSTLITQCENISSLIPESSISRLLLHLNDILQHNNAESLFILFQIIKEGKIKTDTFFHTLITYYLMSASLKLCE